MSVSFLINLGGTSAQKGRRAIALAVRAGHVASLLGSSRRVRGAWLGGTLALLLAMQGPVVAADENNSTDKPDDSRPATPQKPAQQQSGQPQKLPQSIPPTPGQPQKPPEPTPAPTSAPVPAGQPGAVSFRFENADLLQFISIVASQLKMTYVVDPAVKGAVTISSAGDLRTEDLFPILQSVLRINGATAVKVGNIYRIVPLTQGAKMPSEVFASTTEQSIPKDDRMMMLIVPLRFVFAADLAKLLTPFLSDGGNIAVHEGGNILILQDTSLNVKRLTDIIAQFDSPALAKQRVHLATIHNNVASGLLPELESIFSAYAMSEKTPLRFIPLDRINAILAVSADPAVFEEVDKWVEKLDQPVPPTGIQTFIYRVQNSEADYLAKILNAMEGRPSGQTSAGEEVTGGGVSGGAGGAGGMGGTRGGGGGRERTGGGISGTSDMGGTVRDVGATSGTTEAGGSYAAFPRITTDPVDNALIIQATSQKYAEMLKTIKELDIVPREVLIDARVYEVDLTGALSFGVNYFLEERGTLADRKPLGSFTGSAGLAASAGTLKWFGHTRELAAFLNASENRSRVRVLSAPTLLATDNTEARIQVGQQIPILTSQGLVPGALSATGTVFANTIQNMDTGVILSFTPRITSTGMVSLRISQEITQPQAPVSGAAIQSPSFSKRQIITRAVVGDGETIALGGIIQDQVTYSKNRIPLLGDIPGLGVLFGSTSYNQTKTELIVLVTPHILPNQSQVRDATREFRDGLRDLKRGFKKDNVLNR
jgi:general secretion pathway protein D